ncbi:hypothetical protein OG625_07015 [Streptomyces sp. NBC_01351]|uniref:hypothetical protein n=1 Tax=Streptomyces sp. NBC_01351 TaxID=2903833 RepID=UPI002E30BF71|nr:hypothetical protein [Streptomyces sp. NBC_01351]
MMFGYSDEWWVVFFIPVVFWVPFGPFLMAGMGVWCARRPGLWPRLWSWLLPVLPVGVLGVSMVLPLDSWEWEAITLLPWLLGYGITRLVRFLRADRGNTSGAS